MKLKGIIRDVNEHFPKKRAASSKKIMRMTEQLPSKLLIGGYDEWQYTVGHKIAYGVRYLAYSGSISVEEINDMKKAFIYMCSELWNAKAWMDVHLISSTLVGQGSENGEEQFDTVTQYVYSWGIIIYE